MPVSKVMMIRGGIGRRGISRFLASAGIGENSSVVRTKCCEGLEFLSIEIDQAKNERAAGKQAKQIQTDSSEVKIFSIPTNEELAIAQDTRRVILEAEEKKTMRKGL